MDIVEIQNIVNDELATQDAQEAMLNAYYRISIKIIEKRFKSAALSDRKAWSIMKDATYAKSRLRFFLALTELKQDVSPVKVIEALSLYDIWLETIDYYDKNFEIFAVHKDSKLKSREDLLLAKRIISDKLNDYHGQLEVSTALSFPPCDFQFMDQTFGFVQQVILGPELFLSYAEEFNNAVAILALYQVGFSQKPDTPYIVH